MCFVLARLQSTRQLLEDNSMTFFRVQTLEWDWIWASCWMEVLRGECTFTSAFPPEDYVNPCLTQKVHILNFLQSQVEHLVSLFCLITAESTWFNTDPASGFCYPSLDTQWLLLDAIFFSTLRDVLIVKRKSTPERNFISVDSVIYLVLIQGQDIEVIYLDLKNLTLSSNLSEVHLSVISVPLLRAPWWSCPSSSD